MDGGEGERDLGEGKSTFFGVLADGRDDDLLMGEAFAAPCKRICEDGADLLSGVDREACAALLDEAAALAFPGVVGVAGGFLGDGEDVLVLSVRV